MQNSNCLQATAYLNLNIDDLTPKDDRMGLRVAARENKRQYNEYVIS